MADIDEAVATWMVNHYVHAEGFGEHRTHSPTGEPYNMRFGIIHSGYCNTCAESDATVAFDAICSCGKSAVFIISIASWSDLYDGVGKVISRMAYDAVFDDDGGFEAHTSGPVDEWPSVEVAIGVRNAETPT